MALPPIDRNLLSGFGRVQPRMYSEESRERVTFADVSCADGRVAQHARMLTMHG